MLLLLNKPYGVLCKFTDAGGRPTLAEHVDVPGVYAAGRLDKDSEGLVVLTDDGALQDRLAHPRFAHAKDYWVQVERGPDEAALQRLLDGVVLKDGPARALSVALLDGEPEGMWPRDPPVRFRKSVPTAWLDLAVDEGRNRLVRRLTAAVGFPTLRLVRHQVGPLALGALRPGQWVEVPVPPGLKGRGRMGRRR